MKKSITLFTTLFTGILLFASMVSTDNRYENVSKMKSTTLMVAIGEDNATNMKIKNTITKFWTFNSYQFITPDQINKYIKDPKYSVLCLSSALQKLKGNSIVLEHTPVGLEQVEKFSNYAICVVLGDEKNKSFDKAIRIESIDFETVNVYDKKDKVGHLGTFDNKIAHNIKVLQNIIQDRYDKNDESKYQVKSARKKDRKLIYYNEGKEKLQKSTVLINKDNKDKFYLEDFLKEFELSANKVKLVSEDEIAKAIENGDENICYTFGLDHNIGLLYYAKDSKVIAAN